jgi:threonyl-tRNA synthetase
MAIIIEEFEGRLPTWLSPVQVVVVPVSKDVAGYALEVTEKLKNAGIRAVEDLSDETLQKKIKMAYEQAIPYVLVVGRREAIQKTVTVRGRGNLQAINIPLDTFIRELIDEIRERALNQKALINILGRSPTREGTALQGRGS